MKTVMIAGSFLLAFFCSADNAPAGQQYQPDPQGPTVVASGGLTEREHAALQRQYEYQVRSKDMLEPSVPVSSLPGSQETAAPAAPEFQTDGERLHYYFGVAVELYKQGRFEEAVNIFQYLSDEDPDDGYVRSYLARARRDMKRQNGRWIKDAKKEASVLKRRKIRTLRSDGIDHYNAGDLEGALVSFYDLLSVDPKNAAALSYVKKIKARYTKKARAVRAAEDWTGRGGGTDESGLGGAVVPPRLDAVADKMLDKQGGPEAAAEKMVSDSELKDAALNRRAEDILADAEFGASVDAIVAARRAEESRAGQLTLGPGDEVKVTVLNHPELSGDVVVQSSGKIILPLTSDVVDAGGRTLDELNRSVVRALDTYVQSPHVFLSVTNFKSKIFYVVDEVSCTPYPITRPDMTLRDALFLSDWGNNRALGRVIVMRPSAYHPIIKKVDAFDLIYRGNLENDIRIMSGDVIYVPITVAAKVTKVVYDTLAPFAALRTARNMYLDIKWNKADYKNFFREPETYDDESQSATTNNTTFSISPF